MTLHLLQLPNELLIIIFRYVTQPDETVGWYIDSKDFQIMDYVLRVNAERMNSLMRTCRRIFYITRPLMPPTKVSARSPEFFFRIVGCLIQYHKSFLDGHNFDTYVPGYQNITALDLGFRFHYCSPELRRALGRLRITDLTICHPTSLGTRPLAFPELTTLTVNAPGLPRPYAPIVFPDDWLWNLVSASTKLTKVWLYLTHQPVIDLSTAPTFASRAVQFVPHVARWTRLFPSILQFSIQWSFMERRINFLRHPGQSWDGFRFSTATDGPEAVTSGRSGWASYEDAVFASWDDTPPFFRVKPGRESNPAYDRHVSFTNSVGWRRDSLWSPYSP